MITSIKWNPHYVDRTFNGEKLGEKFNFSESKVIKELYSANQKFDHSICKEIIEETPTIYMIYFWDNTSMRVFNPIEVSFSLNWL